MSVRYITKVVEYPAKAASRLYSYQATDVHAMCLLLEVGETTSIYSGT